MMNKTMELNEQLLNAVTGGVYIENLTEESRAMMTEQYRQADGSYRYVCEKCGQVFASKNRDAFLESVLTHIYQEMEAEFENMEHMWGH